MNGDHVAGGRPVVMAKAPSGDNPAIAKVRPSVVVVRDATLPVAPRSNVELSTGFHSPIVLAWLSRASASTEPFALTLWHTEHFGIGCTTSACWPGRMRRSPPPFGAVTPPVSGDR
jgi:hypothetical protein